MRTSPQEQKAARRPRAPIRDSLILMEIGARDAPAYENIRIISTSLGTSDNEHEHYAFRVILTGIRL